jgi:hypothetical protein
MTTPSAERQYPRHALRLPAGSVRAILAFLVLGVLWLLAVYGMTPDGKVPVTFIYLQYVMILIIAHFFVAHGSTIGKHISRHNPLGLPAGSIRFLLLAGYIGLIAWLLKNKREFEPVETEHITLPLVLMAGFLLGYLITRIVGAASSGELPPWFQDFQAWFALVGGFGLAVIIFIRLFIFPHLEEQYHFKLTTMETIVSALIGFYFGARS